MQTNQEAGGWDPAPGAPCHGIIGTIVNPALPVLQKRSVEASLTQRRLFLLTLQLHAESRGAIIGLHAWDYKSPQNRLSSEWENSTIVPKYKRKQVT